MSSQDTRAFQRGRKLQKVLKLIKMRRDFVLTSQKTWGKSSFSTKFPEFYINFANLFSIKETFQYLSRKQLTFSRIRDLI